MRFIFIAACLFNLRRAYARGFTASTADEIFGREQSNSTGGTRPRVATSFTGAHDPKLSAGGGRRGSCAAGPRGAGAVTPGAVRCSAYGLGDLVIVQSDASL